MKKAGNSRLKTKKKKKENDSDKNAHVFVKMTKPDEKPYECVDPDQAQDDSIVHAIQTFHSASV